MDDRPRCPHCGVKHRKMPYSCIDHPDLKCTPQEMSQYLKDAGFWEEFCGAVDSLMEALIEVGKPRVLQEVNVAMTTLGGVFR